jgi:hypothetical protein
MLRILKWQLPGENLSVRYNRCQVPVPGRRSAVEKHCSTGQPMGPFIKDQTVWSYNTGQTSCRLRLKCDGTRAETWFCLSAKRTSQFKSAGALFLSITGSRIVRISGSNAGYTMFRGSVKSTGCLSILQFPLHFPSSASPCAVTFHLASTSMSVTN